MANPGENIAQYMSEASSKTNEVGRVIIFGIMATAWAISFKNDSFSPNPLCTLSLILSILYIVIDYLYYFFSCMFYRGLLVDYFKPDKESGFIYKNPATIEKKKIENYTLVWNKVGYWRHIILTVLLTLSGISLIVELYVNGNIKELFLKIFQ